MKGKIKKRNLIKKCKNISMVNYKFIFIYHVLIIKILYHNVFITSIIS